MKKAEPIQKNQKKLPSRETQRKAGKTARNQQRQTQTEKLGFTNAFIGTVEGEPEDTACDVVIDKVKDAGFKKVVLRPLMVVAGDHANNDMAGDDEDSWKSMFEASGEFDEIDCQIEGLGRIDAVEQLYVEHTQEAIDSIAK